MDINLTGYLRELCEKNLTIEQYTARVPKRDPDVECSNLPIHSHKNCVFDENGIYVKCARHDILGMLKDIYFLYRKSPEEIVDVFIRFYPDDDPAFEYDLLVSP